MTRVQVVGVEGVAGVLDGLMGSVLGDFFVSVTHGQTCLVTPTVSNAVHAKLNQTLRVRRGHRWHGLFDFLFVVVFVS